MGCAIRIEPLINDVARTIEVLGKRRCGSGNVNGSVGFAIVE